MDCKSSQGELGLFIISEGMNGKLSGLRRNTRTSQECTSNFLQALGKDREDSLVCKMYPKSSLESYFHVQKDGGNSLGGLLNTLPLRGAGGSSRRFCTATQRKISNTVIREHTTETKNFPHKSQTCLWKSWLRSTAEPQLA